MHILCLVIDVTPSRQDYLYGKTYGYVLPQLVPRIFLARQSRARISPPTSFQSIMVCSGRKTPMPRPIAFGLLTEAYANFRAGWRNVSTSWRALGLRFKKTAAARRVQPLVLPCAGLFMILLTALVVLRRADDGRVGFVPGTSRRGGAGHPDDHPRSFCSIRTWPGSRSSFPIRCNTTARGFSGCAHTSTSNSGSFIVWNFGVSEHRESAVPHPVSMGRRSSQRLRARIRA